MNGQRQQFRLQRSARLELVEDAVCITPGAWKEAERPAAALRPSALFARCRQLVATRWPAMKRTLPRDLVIVASIAALAQVFSFAYIATDSVHASVAFVIKGARPAVGELAVFSYSGAAIPGYYSDAGAAGVIRRVSAWFGSQVPTSGPQKGDGFVKYLVGVEGDRIERVGNDTFLNTQRGRLFVGRAKTHSKRGVPLEAAREQVIPPGYVYMWAPDVDALDSRYEAMGLVPAASIVGKAVLLW